VEPERPAADRQRHLVETIRQELLAALPADCVRFDIKAYLVVGITHLTVHALTAQRTTVPVDVPTSIQTHLGELRDLMYVPGRGTWFSARLLLTADSFGIVYNDWYDPAWWPGISPVAWVRDLEWFPRDPEHLPEWLRGYLREAGAPVPDHRAPSSVRDREETVVSLVDRMVHELPPLFDECGINAVAYGDFLVTSAVMMSPLDGITVVEVPPEVDDGFRRLRAAMYRPGEGAWLGVQLRITFPDWFTENYRYTATWEELYRLGPPNAADCATELERFPRDPEHVPEWMRETLAR
jgi:hypothetical protein